MTGADLDDIEDGVELDGLPVQASVPPAAAAPVEPHFEKVTGDLDEVVKRLLHEYATRSENPITFQGEQIQFIERVVEHLDGVLYARRLGQSPPQKVFLMLGQGGSGKSELISFVKDLVDSFHSELTQCPGRPGDDGRGPTSVLAAGTNAAAANIGGDTIHSQLYLRGCGSYNLKALADRKVLPPSITFWHDVHLLVVDEISMLSPALLTALSFRVSQFRRTTVGADPGLYEAPGSAFGCIPIVILAGDFMQLPAM